MNNKERMNEQKMTYEEKLNDLKIKKRNLMYAFNEIKESEERYTNKIQNIVKVS